MENEKRKYFWIIVSICIASFISKLNIYIVNISLPTISKVFNVTTSEVSQVVLYFLLFSASTMLIFGKMADKRGLKKIFINGYFVFIIGSLLCGISPNLFILVLSRCVQGVGAAALAVSTYAFVPKVLPQRLVGWGYGLVTTAAGLGVMVGTPLGGIITGYFSWKWVFFVNVPICIIAVIIAQRVIPNDAKDTAPSPLKDIDILGAVSSFLAICLLLYAINMGSEIGWTSFIIVASFILSGIFIFAFILFEAKRANPLLDLSIFKNTAFTLSLLSGALMFMIISGNGFILPFYLEMIKGTTPQAAGFLIMIYSVIYVLVGPFAGSFSDKVNPVILCLISGISGVFCSLFFYFTLHIPGVICTVIFLVWLGISMAFFISPNNKLIMSLVSKNEQGTAAGVYNTFTTLSMAIGTVLFETILSEHISQGKSALSSEISKNMMLTGFRYDYILAALLFFIAAGLCVFSFKRK